MSQTTTESQLNSELSTATTTVPNEETDYSKIDEKIKKLWQLIINISFSFVRDEKL